jgi:hypothetical protein
MNILKSDYWIGSFPLNPFLKKLHALKSVEEERNFFSSVRFGVSTSTMLTTYTWIGFILNRIDEDFSCNLEFFKKLDLVNQGVAVDKLPPHKANLINIDIISLIIFFNILMDDVMHFLGFLFKGQITPDMKSFFHFKNSLGKLKIQGQNSEELKSIILNTDWYEDLKKMRDKHIVHKGVKDSGISSQGIYLRYINNKRIEEKFISNLEIDIMCENVFNFLEKLNMWLFKNLDNLPLK